MDNVVSIPVSLFTYSRFIESKQQLNMPDSTNDEFMLMLLDHITSCDIHMNGSAQSHSGAASMASGTGAGAASDAKQPDDAPASEAASTAAQQTGAIALVSPFSGSSAVAPPPAKQNEGADAGSNLTCQMCGYTCAEEKDFNLHIANHISQLSSIMAAQTPQQPQLDQQAAARPPAQQSAQPVSASMVERKYQCNICGARFKQQRILEQHIDGMHSTTGKYACDSCGQTFKWPGKFYSHKRVCNGQQQQQPPPPPPPLAVSTGSVVNGLPPLHRPPAYQCRYCSRKFRWPPVFYQHQRQCKLNPSVVAASAAGGNGNSRSHGNNSRRKSYTPVKAPEPAAPMRPPVSLSAAAVTPESESAGLSLLRDASSDNSTGGVVSNAANYRCACTAVFASVKAYLNHCDSCPEHSGRGQQQLEQQQQQAQVGSIVDAASLSQLAPSVAGGYTCPQCNNTYSSRLSLKQHIEGMHSIEARRDALATTEGHHGALEAGP
uniref:C2H2-type domain-containing protein n=1 Tax=Macrostomum lignano TaxID=282301 RepID=A0A1I8J3J9_9PLAT